MARSWRADPHPYESYLLTNNNANIRQTKARIVELSAKRETEFEGWAFEGGEVKMDLQANRLQVFFHEKPDRDTCSAMRHGGFRWAPSVGAWQRQLTNNAIWTATHMDCLRPLSGEQLTQEQAGPVREVPQGDGSGWGFYIIADLKTWADNAENRSPLEHFPSFEAAKARFDELRSEPYNNEAAEPSLDGQPPARLTLGLESADGTSAADILHVRQGENYLVTDFIRTERLRDDSAVMDILARISREIGFDRVRVWEQATVAVRRCPSSPSRSGTIPTSPPTHRAGSRLCTAICCTAVIRSRRTGGFARNRSRRSSNSSGRAENTVSANCPWLFPRSGPDIPIMPLFRSWLPR